MPTVTCPSCGRPLEADDAYRDWTVRCPHCATEFIPVEVAPETFESPPPGRHAEPEDGHDRPRRRRRPDPGRDEWERQEALALVHGPGMWLEACGWLGGLLLGGGAALRIAVAVAQGNGGPPGKAEGLIIEGVVSGLLAVPYALVMVVGGRKMRALSSYNWAMTASVMGVASFPLFCCVCICSFFPVGFGIWGIVALNNPLVRRAFDRRRYPAERGWDD